MYNRLFVAMLFTGLLHTFADANEAATIPFVDGRWHGGTNISLDSPDFEECWASTKIDDGTMFKLAKRKDGNWRLQLSNPGWRLPHPHRYALVALVDFYPKLRISAESRNQTILEIADIEHISLLGLIENGHTIDLASEGFNEKYDLEGSAKIIERIRTCFADQLAAERSATVNEPLK